MRKDGNDANNENGRKHPSPVSHSSPDSHPIIPPRGDYQTLHYFRKAEVIYDLTFRFAHKFLAKGDRTIDQMIQSARSGKKNILEGSKAALTSKQTEIKLTNVALRGGPGEHQGAVMKHRHPSANGAASFQPGAKPQERRAPRNRGLKARANRPAVGSGFQPLGIFGLVTQGVALGPEFGQFRPVSRSETTMVALGLSPRTAAKQTIRRRGATAERSNRTVAFKCRSAPASGIWRVTISLSVTRFQA